ncbi:MAG TPA: prepilin-type N-terminal cleavage/methylation domain-containing protein [Terriglobales bacterium]|nr:prepilin-type N-terminal cleavage/methylation domain-containing protein [Terriglobales bacterium]
MPRHRSQHGITAAAGFSLIELLVVISIILIISAMSFMQIQSTLRRAKSETALQTVLGQMRQAHEAASDRRRIYRLTFLPPGSIQLDRMDVDVKGNLTAVFQSTTVLPVEISFQVVPGLPKAGPDGFGTGATAIDFGIDNGGGMNQVFFLPDGRAVDTVNRLNNGVIYMGRPNEVESVRAVTLLGATGRTKPWLVSNGVWVQP